jgi:uncharacterized lipoprotein YddW (UPF0748 family)
LGILALLLTLAGAPVSASADESEAPWSRRGGATREVWTSTRPPRPIPRRALWIEVSANLKRLSSRDAIRTLVAQARSAGIDTLVPEAKNAWGFVIYESQIAPHIRTSPISRAGYGPPRDWFPRDFDPLAVLVEEGHAAGLRVHAAINVFGEGLMLEGHQPVGLALDRPEWQSVYLTGESPANAPLAPAGVPGAILFVNPAHPEVQLYELAVVWEILVRYPVDGIVLDRARYDDLTADFSGLSRARFEHFLGRPVKRWPDDVLAHADGRLVRGPLFPQWVAWRARTIQEFVRAADHLVNQIRPDIPLGMYVGAWYSRAPELGQNWAAPIASASFGAWTANWADASLLPHLDYLMVGLYFRTITNRAVGDERTVAGAAIRARELVGKMPLVGGVWLALYDGHRPSGEDAVRVVARLTDGVMIFDLSDVQEGDWWTALDAR